MADAFKRLIADEQGQVVLREPHEVDYWTAHLGVDEARLRAAVAAAGPRARDVRAWLAAHKPD